MARKLILWVIIFLITISIFGCSGKKAKIVSSKKRIHGATAVNSKQEKQFRQRLKDAILPAVDITQQVRDAAGGIVSGKTKPELAIAIFSGADQFFTDTRAKIIEIAAPGGLDKLKDKAVSLIGADNDALSDLTDSAKNGDTAKIKAVIKELDDSLVQLKQLAGIYQSGERPKKANQ